MFVRHRRWLMVVGLLVLGFLSVVPRTMANAMVSLEISNESDRLDQDRKFDVAVAVSNDTDAAIGITAASVKIEQPGEKVGMVSYAIDVPAGTQIDARSKTVIDRRTVRLVGLALRGMVTFSAVVNQGANVLGNSRETIQLDMTQLDLAPALSTNLKTEIHTTKKEYEITGHAHGLSGGVKSLKITVGGIDVTPTIQDLGGGKISFKGTAQLVVGENPASVVLTDGAGRTAPPDPPS